MTKEEQVQAIQAHVRRNLVRACPVCTNSRWTVLGIVAPIIVWQGEGGTGAVVSQGQEHAPMAMVACGRCFYTLQFLWAPIEEAWRKNKKAADRG